jgi:AraC-like DNA-binding protein
MFLHRVPAPPLSDHIAILWLYDMPAPGHAQERLLPSGSMELVVDLLNRATFMVGAHSQPSFLQTTNTISVVGAHFRPGGAYAFLNLPADELHNGETTLDEVWSPVEASVLRERLLAVPDPSARMDVFERALLARLKRPRNAMVAFAIAQFRMARPVRAVSEQIGVSQRTFINTFAREVGLTPKLYSRVRRFQRVLRTVHGQRDVDWAGVALACGYFDQPHLIRDFRAFAGLSPSAYLHARTEHLNHVPVR